MRFIFAGLFAVAVVWAFVYNANFDKYGQIGESSELIFITVIVVDTPHNKFRIRATEYSMDNANVTVFVMQIFDINMIDNFDIKIVRDGDELHAFVNPDQSEETLTHCQNLLALFEIVNIH